MLPVTAIESAGAASRAGIRPGDLLHSLDGRPVEDMLDVLPATPSLLCSAVYSRDGRIRRVRLRRRPESGWGLHVKGEEPRSCRNRCIFCFVDQQPSGLREGLLHKDDDVRYSFLRGSYITLDSRQVAEAVIRRLSPLHVSIHATDPHLRGRLLGRSGTAPVVPQLRQLRREGIEVIGQLVVVPGLNDGTALEQTMDRLLGEVLVRELGVVPVGLTSHRAGLPELRRPNASESRAVVEICLRFSQRAAEKGYGRWVWPADELFITAGLPLPGMDFYMGCTLQENGIGMLAEIQEGRLDPRGSGTVVTGSLAAPFLERLLLRSGYRVLPVKNSLFGPMVGVAGLLSGEDVIETIRADPNALEAGPFFLPAVMFNGDRLTLDDLTVEDIARRSGAEVAVVKTLDLLP